MILILSVFKVTYIAITACPTEEDAYKQDILSEYGLDKEE
jgi:hypothetical protein